MKKTETTAETELETLAQIETERRRGKGREDSVRKAMMRGVSQ